MAGNLVIVESPAKAGTIQKFLGEDYVVKPSFGHIRDLEDKKLSVDVEHGFAPQYVIPAEKSKVVSELKKLAKAADTVWLASDEDREGEAISWHLYESLGLKGKDTKRIVFHEITKTAIMNAIENPRSIDMNLVDAQQARRVLDRLVGFELSPVLWRKVQPKLSAGRVQSVALRLVVDREREILAFKKEPYYKVDVVFHPEGAPAQVKVKATLDKRFASVDEARKFLEDSMGAVFLVVSIDKKEGTRTPAAPFTTSTLQQEASRKLRFSVSATMRIAQQLYERGLITYMRTDSTNLSSLAINTAREFIIGNYGEQYSKVRQYRTHSKGAQEAHEAIRPTYISNTEIEGTSDEKRLYELIWKRTVASQMADARILKTDIKVASDKRPEKFVMQAMEVLYDGFLKVYRESSDDAGPEDEVILPELNVGDIMEEKGFTADCKFTNPPYRYSEASLVKKLEELGIGRPSTYAPTITTLTSGRGYIVKGDKQGEAVTVTNLSMKNSVISEVQRREIVGAEKSKLIPQEIGLIVTDFLVKNFPDILDYDFTANVEKGFDKIAEGGMQWNSLISDFYSPFHKKVDEVSHDGNYTRVERALGNDPVTGAPIVAKFGQYGPFVQKGEGENRQFAHLAPGQLIESMTLEDALRLFELPRTVGEYEGQPVTAHKGPYGPYIKWGGKNISLPRGTDPLGVSLDECAGLIAAAESKASGKDIIAEFDDIQVLNGRYGPYIKSNGSNYKIPKGMEASALTAEDCRRIIAENPPSRKGYRRRTTSK